MARSWGKCVVDIHPTMYLIVALSALIIPFRWISSWVAAITVHELGHYISLRLFRIEVSEIRINYRGVLMKTNPMSHVQHLICSSAGPFAGFILLPFVRTYPVFATCLFIQSVFNFLPIYPLDGGVILYEMLALFLAESIAWDCVRIIGNMLRLLIVVLMLGFGIQIRSLILFIVLGATCLFKTCSVKFPCKLSKVIVQ